MITRAERAAFCALRERMWTQTEISQEYGVSVQTIANWMSRAVGFPKPVTRIANVSLFDRDEVRPWVAAHLARQAERDAARVAGVRTIGGVKYVRADMVQRGA